MPPFLPLILTPCTACKKPLGLNGTMMNNTLVVCVSCGSHLRLMMAPRPHLVVVDERVSHTIDSQPESYG